MHFDDGPINTQISTVDCPPSPSWITVKVNIQIKTVDYAPILDHCCKSTPIERLWNILPSWIIRRSQHSDKDCGLSPSPILDHCESQDSDKDCGLCSYPGPNQHR
ncbi:hypothetical protein AVEN_52644-1 [Araneus ventricosus]|uniref:Uncharacterized protein n=1 Tax=Araneus ventricosus TaxID=182803 RepID=A0A4Y2PA77_ARAVE|nr:hypothetical protein AVEN_52644-1 [Araneus ventricosus]